MFAGKDNLLPSVDSTIAQLGSVTVFTNPDANSGFW